MCGTPTSASQVLDHGRVPPCLALCSSTFTHQHVNTIFRIALYPSFHKHHQELSLNLLGPPSWKHHNCLGIPSKPLVQLLQDVISWQIFEPSHRRAASPSPGISQSHEGELLFTQPQQHISSWAPLFFSTNWWYRCPIKLLKHTDPKHVPVGLSLVMSTQPHTPHSGSKLACSKMTAYFELQDCFTLWISCRNLHPIFLCNTLQHNPRLAVLHTQPRMFQTLPSRLSFRPSAFHFHSRAMVGNWAFFTLQLSCHWAPEYHTHTKLHIMWMSSKVL